MPDLSSITTDPLGQKFLEHLRPYPCTIGLDLSSVRDLTSWVMAWSVKDKILVYPFFLLPAEGLIERSKADAVPYDRWLTDGYLKVCEGWTIHGQYVADSIIALSKIFKLTEVGFDPYMARDVVRSMEEGGVNCIEVSQSITSLSAPTKRFEELVLSKKLIHTGHPILRWNLSCATLYCDSNNNQKVVKPDSLKSRKRIDGVIATIMAISRIQKAPAQFRSIYADRGVLRL